MALIRSENIVLSAANQQALAASYETVYDTMVAKFFTAPGTTTPATVLGDLTLAALGSAGTTLSAWSDPITLPDGSCGIHHDVSVIAGASPTNETIVGIVVLDGSDILHTEVFADPVPIANVGDAIVYEMIIPIAQTLSTGLSN